VLAELLVDARRFAGRRDEVLDAAFLSPPLPSDSFFAFADDKYWFSSDRKVDSSSTLRFAL
jgi:hypothetical protein